MSDIDRGNLYARLNPTAYQALESATELCRTRRNPYVELIHWLTRIVGTEDSDVQAIAHHFDLDLSNLAADLVNTMDRLPRGATSVTDVSHHIDQAIEQAWLYASLEYHQSQVRTAHVMIGIWNTPDLRRLVLGFSNEFRKIDGEELFRKLAEIVKGSAEQLHADRAAAVATDDAPSAPSGGVPGSGQALAQFATNMTQLARDGEIDPIVGRDDEIRQVVDILLRRRQNNPILVGEAGVGKTAIVEGFALRLASGDVPPVLRDVELWSLDMGTLQAGAGAKGEFENRLKQVIEDVHSSSHPIILFIDEAHTLIGAGGAAGQNDAANLLKPALARGTLRTVAATTWAEYKKYFERDAALTRRFQTVQVDEPDELKAIRMMRKIVGVMEAHHHTVILDSAVESAVKLSKRFIPARQLPDKSVSLLDTACARVAISQHATPPEIENASREIDALELELQIIEREEATGADHAERKGEVTEALHAAKQELEALEPTYAKERELVAQIHKLRASLVAASAEGEEGESGDVDREAVKANLREVEDQLVSLQGESPMVRPFVDDQVVASVVEAWTGIPAGRMKGDEVEQVLRLADTLNERVIGQSHGLSAIAKRIQISRAGLEDPSKPIGVFMLVGPSGVGKTETALSLAEAVYGGEDNVITINMSEFQESHTVSTLKGSPPGYVGYGEGGVLTEAVRRKPYSVVLLDEVEKAHADVHELFFQVFDKGRMEDGEGRMIDFKNTIILLTSNVGSDLIMNLCKDPELKPEPDAIVEALRTELLNVFPAALLGRLVTIPYYPIDDEMIRAIIRLKLGKIERRVRDQHRIPFTYDDTVVDTIAARCTEVESGARNVDAILTNTLLPEISQAFLNSLLKGDRIARVHVNVGDGADFTYAFD